MSTNEEEVRKKINDATTKANLADKLLMSSVKPDLLKRILHASPLRVASNAANIATSSTETVMDQAAVAAGTYSALGHIPVIFGKLAFRGAPLLGNLLMARDAYGLTRGIIYAQAMAGNEYAQVLDEKLGTMEEMASRGAVATLDILSNIKPPGEDSH